MNPILLSTMSTVPVTLQHTVTRVRYHKEIVIETIPASYDDFGEALTWCYNEATTILQKLINKYYNQTELTRLETGVDATGKALPSYPARACDRLGWRVINTNSRVLSIAQAQFYVIMKGLSYRKNLWDQTVNYVINVLSQQQGWIKRNKTNKQARAFVYKTTGLYPSDQATIEQFINKLKKLIPAGESTDYWTVFKTPSSNLVINFGISDKQQCKLVERRGRYLTYDIKLPTKNPTVKNNEWGWWRVTLKTSDYHASRVSDSEHISCPAIRFDNGRVFWDVSIQESSIITSFVTDRAIGTDKGSNNFLKAAIVEKRTDKTGNVTYVTPDSAAYEYDGLGLPEKNCRAQQEGNILWRKIKHAETLINNDNYIHDPNLEDKHAKWVTNFYGIQRKRKNRNNEIKYDYAKWSKNLMIATKSSSVHHEILETLPKNQGKNHGNFLSQYPMGQLVEYEIHRGAREGYIVTQLNAKDSSSKCLCLASTTHKKWVNSECPTCGIKGHRDDLAPARMAQRGLATRENFKPHSRNPDHKVRTAITKIDAPITQLPVEEFDIPTPTEYNVKHVGRRKIVRSKSRTKPTHKPLPPKINKTIINNCNILFSSQPMVVVDLFVAKAGQAKIEYSNIDYSSQ